MVWDWLNGSIDWRLSGTSLRMDSLNHHPLRHFGRSRIVLVPLTKWGIVHWIDPLLTCLVPIKRQWELFECHLFIPWGKCKCFGSVMVDRLSLWNGQALAFYCWIGDGLGD